MIRREDRGRVRLLLLDRPPANVLNFAMLDALAREAREADADPSVRAVVLGSTSPKYFSAGLDLDEILALPEERRHEMFAKIGAAHRAVAGVGKPTVAAMGGAALLGGYVLALAFDWRLLSQDSGKVSLAEIRLGLSPTTPLIRLVLGLTGRPGLVKELVLQGKTLRAQEAQEAGLVDRLLPEEGFLEASLREAERLGKTPPSAYASVKRALRGSLLPDEERLWERGGREFLELVHGAEAQEGMLAMKEKRRPRWE